MIRNMVLDFADFKTLLHDFEDLVSDKHYTKMDYRLWRKVSSTMRSNNLSVFLEWDNHAVDIAFGEEPELYHFVFGDDSFGDFMWDNLLKDSDYGIWDDHFYQYDEVKPEKMKFDEDKPFKDESASNKAYDLKLDIAASESMQNIALECGNQIQAAGAAVKAALLDTPIMVFSDRTADVSFAIDTKVDKAEFDSKLEELAAKVQAVADKYNNKNEENRVMKGFNFDFGPVNSTVVRMSVYGLAVKNKTGTYVSYDTKNEEIMDVDVFNFDGAKFLYKMPVAIKDVAIGDVIVHMNVPMFVVGKSEDGKAVYAVDPVAGERKEIMLTKSPFGFNFVTKVVNFLGNAFNADASNPFGNLGLMMMLSEDNGNMKDMLPLMMLSGNMPMDSNMLVMLAMSNSDKMSDMLPFLFMMNNKSECHCNGNCGGHHQ